MLCVDTSSMIAYLEGRTGRDVALVDQAFIDGIATIAPVTVSELLSDPHLDGGLRKAVLELPVLPLHEGFWERAGLLRAKVLRAGHKAKLADTLIAQCCLDNAASLVTRDADFKVFHRAAGLRVLME